MSFPSPSVKGDRIQITIRIGADARAAGGAAKGATIFDAIAALVARPQAAPVNAFDRFRGVPANAFDAVSLKGVPPLEARDTLNALRSLRLGQPIPQSLSSAQNRLFEVARPGEPLNLAGGRRLAPIVVHTDWNGRLAGVSVNGSIVLGKPDTSPPRLGDVLTGGQIANLRADGVRVLKPSDPGAINPLSMENAPGRTTILLDANNRVKQIGVALPRVGDTLTEAQIGKLEAGGARVLKPGELATMDFRPDRDNVHVDKNNKVVGLAKG